VPELPELEVLRRQVQKELVGRTITGVTVNQPKAINLPVDEYTKRIAGQTIEAIERKGKYLALILDGGDALVVHLALGGALVLMDTAEHDPPHTPFVFALDDGRYLHAVSWQLGSISVHEQGFLHAPDGPFGQLGPDARDEIGSAGELREVIGGSSAGIKARLMNQAVISGIGNAWSDEILFHARLHPMTKTSALSDADSEALYRAMRDVFSAAIKAGGEGLTDLHGRRGTAEEDFAVHARDGEDCPGDCGGKVEAMKVAGRTGYLCPRCQKQR
jgi:formamidopyrimidine-DNA glycosylase